MTHEIRHLHKHSQKQHTAVLKFFDKSMYVIALIPPIMTIPQLLTVWQQHRTSGIAVSTWAAYAISSTLWFAYGLLHKDKPLTLTNLLLLTLDFAIVVGVFVYR